MDNNYLLFTGIAHLFVAFLDLSHTLGGIFKRWLQCADMLF